MRARAELRQCCLSPFSGSAVSVMGCATVMDLLCQHWGMQAGINGLFQAGMG